jgi:lipopolysaccharide transport system ATP-binding protein
MTNPIVEVRHISKRYHLGVINRQTLQDEVRYWWHKTRGRNPSEHMGLVGDSGGASAGVQDAPAATGVTFHDEFWALRDVSFAIQRGEVLGVMGRNGSGKSTLLKILSSITEPTRGEVVLRGRAASLLEVGTGFHPELTGRENIYLNGTILGMKKREIDARFDEIVAFAEIERFLDTPVKRYSSGMYVRLAFAIAAHRDPEILIVDEVLAVGDTEFQRKCMAKMLKVSSEGRTVIFVSHNMSALQSLCNRGILLNRGALVFEGGIAQAISRYHGLISNYDSSRGAESKGIQISALRIGAKPAGVVTPASELTAEVEFFTPRPLHQCYWNFVIEDIDGRYVIHARTEPSQDPSAFDRGWHTVRIHLPRLGIRMGVYAVWFRLHVNNAEVCVTVDSAQHLLEVEGPRVSGIAVLAHDWSTTAGRQGDSFVRMQGGAAACGEDL